MFKLSHQFYSCYAAYKAWEKKAGNAAEGRQLIEKFNKIVNQAVIILDCQSEVEFGIATSENENL
mgnify:CR=1 FL=1